MKVPALLGPQLNPPKQDSTDEIMSSYMLHPFRGPFMDRCPPERDLHRFHVDVQECMYFLRTTSTQNWQPYLTSTMAVFHVAALAMYTPSRTTLAEDNGMEQRRLSTKKVSTHAKIRAQFLYCSPESTACSTRSRSVVIEGRPLA